MSVKAVIQKLEPILTGIEMNSVQADVHGSNARTANTIAALSYLFTSNSKNSTTRTIGQVAAVGGLVYGNSQRNQENAYQQKNTILIGQAINLIEREGIVIIRQERNVDVIRQFIDLNLKLGHQLDMILGRYISSLSFKGHLGKPNIQLLFNLNNIDLISYKLRLNKIFQLLDSGKQIGNLEQDFIQSRQYLNVDKIIREGLIARGIILGLVIGGLVLIQRDGQSGVYIFLCGLLFWLANQFFPLFPETRKLRGVVRSFIGNIKGTLGIRSISFK